MKILLKVYSFKFQFSNGLISLNALQPRNIPLKLVPFDTFQLYNDNIQEYNKKVKECVEKSIAEAEED